jgi:hypothetical protein
MPLKSGTLKLLSLQYLEDVNPQTVHYYCKLQLVKTRAEGELEFMHRIL